MNNSGLGGVFDLNSRLQAQLADLGSLRMSDQAPRGCRAGIIIMAILHLSFEQ